MQFEWLPIRTPSIIDIIDILVMSFIIYKLLIIIKGTRAVQMMIGIVFLIMIYFLSDFFGLTTLKITVQGVITYFPIAIIVIFQNEIRKILAKLGTNKILQLFSPHEISSEVDQIVKAAEILSKEKKGGLIILQQEQGLKQYIETGIPIESVITYDLLVNIFEPKTPLHDGAVIIGENRIIAASCLLPLSSNTSLPPHFGTRHRAGIGITEETDSVAVIVSEETGKISFSKNGTIMHYKEKSTDSMIKHLNGLLEMDKKKPESSFKSMIDKWTKKNG